MPPRSGRRPASRPRAWRCSWPAAAPAAPSARRRRFRDRPPRASPRGRAVGGEAVRLQELGEPADRIAPRFGFALRRRLVQLLVVGQRVRVRPDDTGVDERRTVARAHVRRPPSRMARRLARKSVPSIESTWRPGNDRTSREMSPPGVWNFDRHRNRVAVVLDQEQHRQLPQAGRVDRFPELAFARRAVAERGERRSRRAWNRDARSSMAATRL